VRATNEVAETSNSFTGNAAATLAEKWERSRLHLVSAVYIVYFIMVIFRPNIKKVKDFFNVPKILRFGEKKINKIMKPHQGRL